MSFVLSGRWVAAGAYTMFPDPLVFLLARVLFGLTIAFHYLFVPLTLGLIVAIAAMDSLFAATGRRH